MIKFNTNLPAPNFFNNEDRNNYVGKFLIHDGISSCLNVGSGGKRHLYNYLAQNKTKKIKVFDIDMVGDCDLKINLDEIDRIPLEDGEFDTVISLDNLEHLESFYLIFNEMFRIASKEVIISLPIGPAEIPSTVILGRRYTNRPRSVTGAYSKFYGLPLEAPTDRHRWFIYYEDIIELMEHHILRNPSHHVEVIRPKVVGIRKLLKLLLPSRVFNNFFVPYLIVIIKKNSRIVNLEL
jgi:hypothetical protein